MRETTFSVKSPSFALPLTSPIVPQQRSGLMRKKQKEKKGEKEREMGREEGNCEHL